MSGRASRTGLIGCVAALLWIVAASSAHAAPTWLPAFSTAFPAEHVAMSADGTTPGRYRAAITAADAAGNAAKPVTLAFRIVRR